MDLQELAKNYKPIQLAQPTQPKSKKGSGNQSFLSSLISEGGAGLGAAIGSLLGPVGTIAGAGLGGFIGRLGENQVRDREMRVGDALKEGVASAAFSGVGQAFNTLKGAKAAKSLAKAGIADDVASGVSKTAKMGRLQTGGLKLKSSAKGYGIGTKTSMNKEGLSFDDVADVDSFIKKYSIKGNTPAAIQTNLSKSGVVDKIGKQLGLEYRKSGAKFSADELSKTAAALKKEVLSSTSFDRTSKANMRYLDDLVKKFKSSGDAEKMFNFKSTSSLGIKDAGSSDKLVDRELMLRAFRSKATELLDSKIPKLSGLNKDYSLGKSLTELSKTGAREAQRATGSIIAAAKQGTPGRMAQSTIGAGMQGLGAVTGSEFGKQIARQTPYSVYNAIGGQAPQQQESQMQDPTQMLDTTQMMSPLTGALGGQEQAPEIYSREALMSDVQRDPKNATKYIDLYQALAETTGTKGGTGLNVTKPTSEKFSQAYGGMQALNQLEQIISQGGVPKGTRAPGRGVEFMGIGGDIRNMTGTGEFDAVAFNTVDNLLRILTGAQAPESEIRRYMNQYIPKAGDSEQTVQTKLNLMRQQFNSILQLAQMDGTGSQVMPNEYSGNTLYDSMLNIGGAY